MSVSKLTTTSRLGNFLKGACSGHVNHLNFGRHQPNLWNGWSYSGQILYTGRLWQVSANWWL